MGACFEAQAEIGCHEGVELASSRQLFIFPEGDERAADVDDEASYWLVVLREGA